MRRTPFGHSLPHQALIPFVLLTAVLSARAERLPIRTFSTADGLPSNIINRIVRDSRGFLWFCTAGGLSRFDGYTFTNYGTEQGLPHASVNDLLETHDGQYWVATSGGLARFDPKGTPSSHPVSANENYPGAPPMFHVVLPDDPDRRARYVTSLVEAHDGHIWCGTFKGLAGLIVRDQRFALVSVEIGFPGDYPEHGYVNDIVEDRFGSLWLATPSGLYRHWTDKTIRYAKGEVLPDDFIHDLLLDHQGQLWVSTRNAGFFQLTFDETDARPQIMFRLFPHDSVQSEWINQLFETSDHQIWAATARGLLRLFPEGNAAGPPYRVYTNNNGLSDYNISALGEDTGGNLWLGSTNGTGVMRLAHNGFVTYAESDGIRQVNDIFEDRAGGLCLRAFVVDREGVSFGRFDGHDLSWFIPGNLDPHLGWVNEGVTLRTHRDEWWLANPLFHFAAADNFTKLKTMRPLDDLGQQDLLRGRQVWRLFEDSSQRLWISVIDSAGNSLAFWEPQSRTLHEVTDAAGLPSVRDDLAGSFAEDRAGNVWIGFNTGLVRARGNAFSFFTTKDGVPAGGIAALYVDQSARLWIASTRGGLARVDDPNADQPAFISYTTDDGLSSNSIDVITEDAQGRIYAGTGRGLDQLEPATGRIKHFTTADGLAAGTFKAAFRDRNGTLWFGTSKGLPRFTPAVSEQPAPPPTIFITGLSVAGTRHLVSALGEQQIALPDLPSNSNQVQIDFVGLSFIPGDVLRYQYRLGNADWTSATDQRVINFANLSAGSYRFAVRAINSDGQVSSEPAVVTFTVLTPLWLRWWFLTLAALAFVAVGYAVYRYRVARLLEIANMRTRIATDLHDDIGANLTRISILSEVAKQQFGNGGEQSRNPLTSIADIARESVTSMSDIVWAINPERDNLRDLVRKMRQHADEVFTLRDIDLEFHAPGPDQELKLGVNVRRDLLLIFKEAVSNAARHSDCSRVKIDFAAENHRLCLRIADNGSGFDAASESSGHGLTNMVRRARNLGGELQIDSNEERGTTVSVEVPLPRVRLRA